MLGGNLPDTRNAMEEALKKFAANGVKNIRCSEIMISSAVDCVPDTPDFLDMAFVGWWEGSPNELLDLCQQLEVAAGRPIQHSSRESRILDCDIIFFGDTQMNTPALTIPHPRAQQRRFVLEPMSQLIPQQCFPDGLTVLESLAKLV